MKIREMVENDYAVVCRKLSELYEEHSSLRPDYYNEIESVDLLKLLKESDLKLVADAEGSVVGFVRGELVGEGLDRFAVVHDIFVDELQRGKGVGSVLMNDFYRKSKSSGAKTVRLQVDFKNISATSFWENEGFETTHLKMVKSFD